MKGRRVKGRRVAYVRQCDVRGVKGDVRGVKCDVRGVKCDVRGVECDVARGGVTRGVASPTVERRGAGTYTCICRYIHMYMQVGTYTCTCICRWVHTHVYAGGYIHMYMRRGAGWCASIQGVQEVEAVQGVEAIQLAQWD